VRREEQEKRERERLERVREMENEAFASRQRARQLEPLIMQLEGIPKPTHESRGGFELNLDWKK
jgi:hypothetical protein